MTRKKTAYLAAPVGMYETTAYDQVMAALQKRHKTTLLGCRGLFNSATDWKRSWTRMLEPIKTAYVLTHHAGWVGRGVYIETQWLQRRGAALHVVHPDGTLAPFYGFQILQPDNWTRYATLITTEQDPQAWWATEDDWAAQMRSVTPRPIEKVEPGRSHPWTPGKPPPPSGTWADNEVWLQENDFFASDYFREIMSRD